MDAANSGPCMPLVSVCPKMNHEPLRFFNLHVIKGRQMRVAISDFSIAMVAVVYRRTTSKPQRFSIRRATQDLRLDARIWNRSNALADKQGLRSWFALVIRFSDKLERIPCPNLYVLANC